MYFIVYLINEKKCVTVPHTWIQDMHEYIENFVNNGLNKKKFLTFYTDNSAAFEGTLPRASHSPNLGASLNASFPKEGWYRCYVRKFKCK